MYKKGNLFFIALLLNDIFNCDCICIVTSRWSKRFYFTGRNTDFYFSGKAYYLLHGHLFNKQNT